MTILCKFALTVEGTTVFETYVEVEMKCRLTTKRTTMVYYVNTVLSVVLPSIVHSIICMWRNNFDTKTWYFPAEMSFPFDASTVLEWYMLLLLAVFTYFIYIAVLISVIICMINYYLYIGALCNHFKTICHEVDTKITGESNRSAKAQIDFKELVLFHAKLTK